VKQKAHTKEQLAFSIRGAAIALNTSPTTVHGMVKNGTLKHRRYGKRVFISREAINDFLAGEAK
jgi:excisionase family DNA binding protein